MKSDFIGLVVCLIATTAHAQQQSIIDCIAAVVQRTENLKPFLAREITLEERKFLYESKQLSGKNLPTLSDNHLTRVSIFITNKDDPIKLPKFLARKALFQLPPIQELPQEPQWMRGGRKNEIRWLLLGTLNEPGPYSPVDLYYIDFPDLYCCVFQIKDDPLDNRLGVDLEVLYEDLQLIISHRPNWTDVPAGKLKTDFAKAVLARLLGGVERMKMVQTRKSDSA